MPVMNKQTRKKFSGLIGLGMMYMWACATMYWADSAISFLGAGLVSVSGIAVFFYINSLEQELSQSSRRQVNGLYED